jgi:putative transposase
VDNASGPQLPDGSRAAGRASQIPDPGPCGSAHRLLRRHILADGIRILASPPQAPRANAICEQTTGTLRRELLDWLLIVNEYHLRHVLTEYLRHYNTARPYRGLGQLAPDQAVTQPPAPANIAEHRSGRRQVLGGLTREFHIAA